MSAEARFAEWGLTLPPAPEAMGLYRPVVIIDRLAYLSGHLPLLEDGTLVRGRLGDDLDLEAGTAAARRAGLATLATLQAQLGTLDAVVRIVKTFGLVQCTRDFIDQPAVINGFSQLMSDVFGPQQGIGARSAVGASALPAGSAVEIESIFEIRT